MANQLTLFPQSRHEKLTVPQTIIRALKIKRKALDGWPAHPAYVYGNERLSCALCILANNNDLRNGERHQPELAAHYIHLEEVGGATFKLMGYYETLRNAGVDPFWPMMMEG